MSHAYDEEDDGTEMVALVARDDDDDDDLEVSLSPPPSGQRPGKIWLIFLAGILLGAFVGKGFATSSSEQPVVPSVEDADLPIVDPKNSSWEESPESNDQASDDSVEVEPATSEPPTPAPVTKVTNAPTKAPIAPTSSPTKQPMKPKPVPQPAPKKNDNSNPLKGFEDGFPHVVYNDKHYRRVCSDVGLASHLCLTIRYPFQVPEQDPSVTYVKPFTRKYFDMDRKGDSLNVVTGKALEQCQEDTQDISIEDAIKHCLDSLSNDKAMKGAAVFVRRSKHASWHLYDRQTEEQVARARLFFDGEVALSLGASPTPGVGKEIAALFGKCHLAGKHVLPRGANSCPRYDGSLDGKRRRRLGLEDLPDEDQTFIGVGESFYGTIHGNPNKEPLEILRLARKPGWKSLRGLTLILDYPIAHSQDQDIILGNWTQVVEVQNDFAKYFLDLQNKQNTQQLHQAGYNLKRLIVFDGLPQTFPSNTSAYPQSLHRLHWETEEAFQSGHGYEGWKPDYGTTCQGPVAPNAKLSEVNRVARQAFKDQGFDMRWYGKTWEFANQFWWKQNGCTCSSSVIAYGLTTC